ncbi:MAG: HAD family phosphatase [Blautia sp.]|nr:HAD family phosphatase [Blautia sp.]
MTDTTISHHGRTGSGKSLSPRRFAVVFDMDGVILDTERIVIECWQDIAEKYRIPDIETACIASLGLTAEATIRTFGQIYGEDFPYEQYKAEMRELFFGKHYGEHLPLKPGAEDILKRLKEKGIPIALASSTREAVVRKELEDAGVLQYFDKLICGDMVMHSKPHPEIFLTACKELGVNPEDTYAVEDSFNGIRSAYSGGLRTIMVPDQVQPDEEIRALSTKVCQSLYEAADYLLQNL